MLEDVGYGVITATSGVEALEILKKEKPDLILLDVMMPGLDGWTVCKMIKRNKDTKDITVAMLTVRTGDENKILSLDEAIADWHISKPIDRGRFLKTVEWLLQMPLKR